MSSFLYLFRNGDLYKIGRTEDLQSVIKKLSPDEIVKTIETDKAIPIEARLINKYKSCRIPETEYFRLNKIQVEECINQININSNLNYSLKEEANIGFTGSLIIGVVIFISAIVTGTTLAHSAALAFLGASIPMLVLILTGSFGGYDAKDVPFFSTWSNRLKGTLFATVFACIAYTLEALHKLLN